LPMIDRGVLPTKEQKRKEEIEQILIGMGFYEVITDGFYGANTFSQLSLPKDHPLHTHISTKNALDRGYSLLKNNAFLHAISALSKNIKRHFFDVKMYEWTRIFVPDAHAENGVCREKKLLWGAVCGKERPKLWTQDPHKSDVFFLKGVIEELAQNLRLPFMLQPADPQQELHPLLHPYRQAKITLRGVEVGILGEIHPEIATRFKIKKQRPCYFELTQESLFSKEDELSYRIPDAIQPLIRTISFGLPHELPSENVRGLLAKVCSSVQVCDVFPYQEKGLPRVSVTFSMRFDNPKGELSADYVNQTLRDVIEKVCSSYPTVEHR